MATANYTANRLCVYAFMTPFPVLVAQVGTLPSSQGQDGCRDGNMGWGTCKSPLRMAWLNPALGWPLWLLPLTIPVPTASTILALYHISLKWFLVCYILIHNDLNVFCERFFIYESMLGAVAGPYFCCLSTTRRWCHCTWLMLRHGGC